ncbi:MAG: hypothetical protein CO001_03580, partial [Candidatus Portnoybacteria bacterium CG_4_8_14_3_um_filter_40_10]
MGDIEKKLFSTVPFIVILILAAIFVWPIFLKNAPTHAAISESIILYDPVTSCLISTAQNNLTWDSTVTGSPTYYILRKLDGDITYSQIGQTPNTFFIDNTIDSDKKYRYQIRAERGSDIFFSDNEVVSLEAYCQALFSPPQTSCQADG